MASYGGHFATTCFEHVFAYSSRTARNSSMKFYMYIHLDKGYPYSKLKVIDMMSSGVKGQKNVFIGVSPISLEVIELEP